MSLTGISQFEFICSVDPKCSLMSNVGELLVLQAFVADL